MITRDNRNLSLFHNLFGLRLWPHFPNSLWRRSDKADILRITQISKNSILTQKTKTRVDCLATRPQSDIKNPLLLEIGLGWRITPYMESLIGHLDVFWMFIDIWVDGHCFDAHGFGRAEDTTCDFPSICD